MSPTGQKPGFWKQSRSTVALVAIAVVVIVAIALDQKKKPKPSPPPTRAQAAQNECSKSVYENYINQQAMLARQAADLLTSRQPITENTLAERRLQETFCQQFVKCLPPEQPTQDSAQMESFRFKTCLDDEVRQEVDEDRDSEPTESNDDH